MDAGTLIRTARRRAGLSPRELGRAAGISRAVIAEFQAGREDPSFQTLVRILRAAGFELRPELRSVVGGVDPAARGRDLVEALELAAQFPARHDRYLNAPVFGRR